jgi:hypothetical protein
VKALVRTPGRKSFPAGVTEVAGDLTDVASLRKAFASVRADVDLRAHGSHRRAIALGAWAYARRV